MNHNSLTQNEIDELFEEIFEKEKIEKHEGLFEKAIQNMDLCPVIFGKHYLCLTCRKYLVVKGTMQPMSHCNNLGFKYVGKKLDGCF